MAIMNVWAARAQDLLTVTRISHSETSRIMGRKRPMPLASKARKAPKIPQQRA